MEKIRCCHFGVTLKLFTFCLLSFSGLQVNSEEVTTADSNNTDTEQLGNAKNPSKAYKRAFAKLMTDPSNPENSFQFAREAIKSGDLQGGITSFERILKINPNLDNIKLELGVLYLRVGANELANRYLGEAVRSPEIPIPVKNRAKSILKQAQKAASPHSFSFRVGLGAQYDDNATSSPTSPEVLVAGQPALLDEASLGESDSAAVFSASGQYVYNLNSQIGNQLEAGFSYSNRTYDESTEIDSDYIAFQVGPRFYFGELLNPSWSLKPFVRASRLDLEDTKYQETMDYGIDLSKIFSVTQMASLRLMYSDNEFTDSDRRTTASERDGEDIDIDLRFSKNFRSDLQGFFGVGGNERNAEVDYQERSILRVSTGFSKSYRAPFGINQRWNSAISLSFSDIDYDAPDPAIDPDEKREEERSQFSWNNTLVFNRNFYTTVSVYYTDNQASLPNYEYDNTGINLTLWATF